MLVSTAYGVLMNQLRQAEVDLNRLLQLRDDADEDPLKFIDDFRNNKLGPFPKPQRIAATPLIDFEKYESNKSKRNVKYPHRPVLPKRPAFYNLEFDPLSVALLQGNAYHQDMSANSTPETRSSRFWKEDELILLKQLMVKYPASDKLTIYQRGRLIANELTSRSVTTICVKMKSLMDNEEQRNQSADTLSNTALEGTGPSNEALGSSKPRSLIGSQSSRLSGAHYLLQKAENPITDHQQPVNPVHHGFSCDSCAIEPIVGIRWSCEVCPQDIQVDLCNECVSTGYETETHKKTHSFLKIDEPEEVQELEDEYGYLGY